LPAADTAVEVNLDLRAHRLDDAGQGADAGLGAVELAAAVVADDDRVCPRVGRELGILDVHDALEDELATPALFDPLDIGPVERGVELLRRPRRQAAHVGHAFDVPHDVAELPPWRAQHAPAPTRLGHHVQDVGQGQFGRCRQTVFQVLVALTQNLQVQRQHQRTTTGGLGAVDQARDEVAVAHHIELKPKALAGVLGHVLDRADTHGGERERHAKRLGRPGGEDFAVGVLHAGQPCGRQRHGHGHGLADHGGARAARLHRHGHALAQADGLKVRFVGAIGALGPRAAVGVVVEHARHAPLRQAAQVFDAGDDGHGVSSFFAHRSADAPSPSREMRLACFEEKRAQGF
jgi:hypothetical protein